MHSHHKKFQLLAIGLAILAGFTDALGFLKLGGLFVSFMSGNSTRFGVDTAGSIPLHAVFLPFAIIVMFVIGVMLGNIVRWYFPRKPSLSVLGFMFAALTAAALFHVFALEAFVIPLMVIAMGAANNVFIKEGEVAIGVTYMTGTLVKLGQRLAGAIFRKEGGSSWIPYLLLWSGLVAGAALGAFCYGFLGLSALWLASAFCLVLVVFSATLKEKS